MEFPLRLDQVNEVLVLLDLWANGCVVVVPLSLSDAAILVLVAEALQEFGEDLVEAHLAGDDQRVLWAVEVLSNVEWGHITVAVLVKLVVSLRDPADAQVVGLPTDIQEELVKVNGAVLVSVQHVEQHLGLSLGDCHAVVLQPEVELLLVQLAWTVIGPDHSERSREASQLSGSLRQYGFLNLGKD